MKKNICMLFALILVVNLAIPARAVSTEYEIPEFGLTISIPDGYDVFTRDMKENDPLLGEYGFTKADILEIMGADIYLNALSPQGDEEIIVAMRENLVLDFASMGDTELRGFASSLGEEYEKMGLTVFSSDVCHHSQMEFVCTYFHMPEEDVYAFQYYTIYGGNSLSIVLRSYTGAITDAQEQKIQAIVDSVNISSDTPEESQIEEPRVVEPQIQETSAFLYTDEKTGTTFTVPTGWAEMELSKEQEALEAQFYFAKDPNLVFAYATHDMTAGMSSIERQRQGKFEHKEAYCADFAAGVGIPESSISIKTYNGNPYYIYEIPNSSITHDITITQALHIENGWAYYFQIMAAKDSPYFGELEKVLESVKYGDQKTQTSDGLMIAVVIVLLLFLILLIIGIRTARKSKKEAYSESVYCPSCGRKLPGDSRFCEFCGARLTKKEIEQ